MSSKEQPLLLKAKSGQCGIRRCHLLKGPGTWPVAPACTDQPQPVNKGWERIRVFWKKSEQLLANVRINDVMGVLGDVACCGPTAVGARWWAARVTLQLHFCMSGICHNEIKKKEMTRNRVEDRELPSVRGACEKMRNWLQFQRHRKLLGEALSARGGTEHP